MVGGPAGRDGPAVALAVRVGDHARLVWGSLSGRDFAAIEDLEVVAQADGGLHDIKVVLAHYMTAVVITDHGVMVYAIGRPT